LGFRPKIGAFCLSVPIPLTGTIEMQGPRNRIGVVAASSFKTAPPAVNQSTGIRFVLKLNVKSRLGLDKILERDQRNMVPNPLAA
jgi:hypothetical protein